MKYAISFFILCLIVACSEQDTTATIQAIDQDINESLQPEIPVLAVSMYDVPLTDRELALNDPYQLEFEVVKTGEGQFTLMTSMKLNGGSFYVSPHSRRDFSGKFTVEVAPNEHHLKIGSNFSEIPRSKEVIDQHQFVNGAVNWVTVDTRYEYPLEVLSKEDFTIGGKIFFTIEPKCTLEQIPLMFTFKDGVLTAEKWEC